MRPKAWALAAAALLTASAAPAQDGYAEQSLALANEARRAEGRAPLSLDDRLVAAAVAHAEDMLARDYYGHVSSEGDTVQDRFVAEGGSRWRLVSENIAMCRGCPTPPDEDRVAAFHEGWMESPEHRATLLDPGLEHFGFGMASGEDVVYAVQTFAGPGRPAKLGPEEPEEAIGPEALTARALEAVNAAREEEGAAALGLSAGLDRSAAALTEDGVVRERLEEVAGGNWASVGMVAGECGGCGTVPTAADVESFIEGWLGEPDLAEVLLGPEARAFGFAMSADGEGRKGAVALVAR